MTNSRPSAASNRQKVVANPQAILVLGMHRSGTSALTRVLNLLGCALPGELIEPNDSNELGHWESAAAVALNDRILASAGSKWDDWGPINPDWRESSIRGEMISEVTDLLADHSKLGSLFALKDPRLCRIADVWLDAMNDAKVTPLIAMIIRNPTEVALSLESRDLMSQGYGQLLWLRHVLDAERLSRGQRRVVVTYDQLLGNWFEVADRIKTGLDVAFPRNSPAVHMEIEAFLSPMHRHHQQPVEKITKNLGLSEWLRRTLSIMLAWSENGEDEADYPELDAIGHEFDRSYTAFARLLIQNNAAGEVGSGLYLKQQLTAQIAEAQQASAQAQASIKEAEEKLAAQAAREATLAAQLQAELERMQQMQSELAALRDQSEASQLVNAEAQTLREAEANLTAQIAQMQASLKASASNAEALQAEVTRLQGETATLAEVQAEAEALREAEAKLAEQIAHMEATLSASASQAEGLQTEVSRLQAETEAFVEVQAEAKALREAEAKLAEQIAHMEATLGEASSRAESLDAEVARLMAETIALGKWETEAKALREQTAELDKTAARLQKSLDEAEKNSASEKERRLEAEMLLQQTKTELERQTWKAEEYSAQSSTLKSTLIQREEELSQIWKQLLEAEKTAAIAQTKSAQEIERREAAEKAMAELRQQAEKTQQEQSQAAERLAAEVAMTTRLLRDENMAATTAQKALAAAEAEFESRNRELSESLEKLRQTADAELKSRNRELSESLEKLRQVESRLERAERKQSESARESATLIEKLQRAEHDIESAHTARAAAERKLASRFDEIARLTTLLSNEAAAAGTSRADAEWLREVTRVSLSFPKWWGIMPAKWRRKKEHARYLRRGLFDAEQYLINNPDVAHQNIDPLLHYIVHGSQEGRTWRV